MLWQVCLACFANRPKCYALKIFTSFNFYSNPVGTRHCFRVAEVGTSELIGPEFTMPDPLELAKDEAQWCCFETYCPLPRQKQELGDSIGLGDGEPDDEHWGSPRRSLPSCNLTWKSKKHHKHHKQLDLQKMFAFGISKPAILDETSKQHHQGSGWMGYSAPMDACTVNHGWQLSHSGRHQ